MQYSRGQSTVILYVRLQIISHVAGCQGAARSREQIQMGGGGRSKGRITLKWHWLLSVTITSRRRVQRPGPTVTRKGRSSRTSRRVPEGPSNASQWLNFHTTALLGILSPKTPPFSYSLLPTTAQRPKAHSSHVLKVLSLSLSSILLFKLSNGEGELT